MIFYRIARARFDRPATAFSGEAAAKYDHRWSQAASDIRAVYCSDTLALACLECLVHLRPAPRMFPASVYYVVDIPDALLERPERAALPKGWGSEVAGHASRDFGTEFLRSRRAAGLVVPTAILPLGENLLLNPLHPKFSLTWITDPEPYRFDQRLK